MSEQTLNFTQLLDTFQLFDKNKDGCISASELRLACEKLHMPIKENRLREIFQNRESIRLDEFCRIMQEFGQQPADAYFKETFRAFDRNSDGFITVKEIKKTMKNLGESLTDKQAKDMLKAADTDGDGRLSETEFRSLFDYVTQQATTPPISPLPVTPNADGRKRTSNPWKTTTES